MLKAKSDKDSDEFKYDGNVFYRRNEKFNALMCYNKSLCAAESKEKIALAYGNRSAVYFELKIYDECLQNIQWAKENDYPSDKVYKLNEREERCKQLKESEVKDPADDAKEFFKLSYPPNPKIPFIVDCIEIRKLGKRGIFATRDLKAGDIIAIEEFAFARVLCSGQYNRCCFCAKINKMSLIPCLNNASLMYCSKECRDKTYKHHEDLEVMLIYGDMLINTDRVLKDVEEAFGGSRKLTKFLKKKDIDKMNDTIFDFDWNDAENVDKNRMKCLLSLDVTKIFQLPMVGFFFPSEKITRGRQSYQQLYERLKKVINGYSCFLGYLEFEYSVQMCPQMINDGLTFSTFGPLFNHSCMSNVCRVFFENNFAFYVTKPVKKGQELFISLSQLPYHSTPKILRNPFMNCKCYACKHDLKPSDFKCQDRRLLNEAIELSDMAHKKVAKTKAQLKENWKIIAARSKDKLSVEVSVLQKLNYRMIRELGFAASFPC